MAPERREGEREAEGVSRQQSPYCNAGRTTQVPGALALRCWRFL
jgi:hypothetical protein